mmetsp:Transcript_50175/g.122440  ORF Transcript_50175/g.122440 Transcript_50175/m.122440 type:complete len:418 (+) Transcript_50175:364-1617(+)|eukprot:CAMPEP_0206235160 /NCGR_PEP_ID=MMETSP0047_2-20121206/12995_1 /ASSEMBLY_ACC=CAM_ASM_000192 /TAXON_ID=195065 /ORGANISM="Chroomonas mesostigmatica_cf, Strain CCMP1168" /LENGTH=417 /DNA_ID=CAMNT_0053659333 /DNA_START=363 /DNA_END=1616 /DNA_ORIENTATION=+
MMATEDLPAMRAPAESIMFHNSGSSHSQSTPDRALAASRKSVLSSNKKSASSFAALGLAEGNAITDELVHMAMKNKVQVRTSDGYRQRLAQCGMADPVAGQHGVIVKVYEAGAPGEGLKCDVMWDSGRGLTGYHTKEGLIDLVVAPARGSSKDLTGASVDASVRSHYDPSRRGSSEQIEQIASIVQQRPENLVLDVTVGYLGQAPPPMIGGCKSMWGDRSFKDELVEAKTPKGQTPKGPLAAPSVFTRQRNETPKARKPQENAKDLSGKLAKQMSSTAPLSQFSVDNPAPKQAASHAQQPQSLPSLQQFVPTGNTPQKSGYKRPASHSPSPTGSSAPSVSTADGGSPSSESPSPPGSAAPMASARSSEVSNPGTARYKLPGAGSGGSNAVVPKKDLEATSEEEVEGEASWDGQMGYV